MLPTAPQPKSYSAPYEDERFRDRYAIIVRHVNTVEILRFRTPDGRDRQVKALRKQGYRKARQR